jgi:hypothetical protein
LDSVEKEPPLRLKVDDPDRPLGGDVRPAARRRRALKLKPSSDLCELRDRKLIFFRNSRLRTSMTHSIERIMTPLVWHQTPVNKTLTDESTLHF